MFVTINIPDYEKENGYCIKINSSPKRSRKPVSVKRAFGKRSQKCDDIKKMKLPKNFAKYFHIERQRKDSKSPLAYQDGTGITFFRWAKHEPDNVSRELYNSNDCA